MNNVTNRLIFNSRENIRLRWRTRALLLWASLALLLSLGGCATKKKGKQGPSAAKQAYENMTGYYNAYFNANEILQISYEKLKDTYRENFNELLPLYPFQTADISPVKGDLDKAIDKLIKNINSHDVSHWQDDSYVMIGEIQMLKKDYETAEETLEYFVQAFDPLKAKNKSSSSKSKKKKKKKKKRKKKKRKKKKKKSHRKKKRDKKKTTSTKEAAVETPLPASSTAKEEEGILWWKHSPAYKNGLILLARTYIERGKPSQARNLLRRLREQPNLTEEQQVDIGIAQAHLYIRQNQKKKAIALLAEILPKVKSKDDRTRYWFILGQLEGENGQCAEATHAFEQVIDLRRDYNMEFHALLHKIKCTSPSDSKDSDKVIRRLKKLMKDEKNEEFVGHIYDAMAAVELRQGNTEQAKEYYRMALSNTEDSHLKQKIYLKLAHYFLDSEDYLSAKLYLDSTLMVMDKDYPERSSVEKQRDHLNDIADQLSIIQNKDSLLRLGALSEAEQLALAKKLASKAKSVQDSKELAEINKERNDNLRFPGGLPRGEIQPQNSVGFQLRSNNFFAYSPILLRKGKTEFKRQWGGRKLEDHWRRSKKDLLQTTQEESDSTNTEKEAAVTTSTDDRNLIRTYLPGIPRNKEQKEQLDKEIEDALYLLGKLYRDQLNHCEKSTATLKELLHRYPKSRHEAGALYYLYLCADAANDHRMAKEYRTTLVQKYPSSLYTKVLEDPDFLKKWLAEQNKEEGFYQQTYALFTRGDYSAAKKQIEAYRTLKDKKNTTYDAKFALLSAMIEGREGKDVYIKGLKDVIAKYPDAPETIRAKEIMRFLQGDEEAFDSAYAPSGDNVEYEFQYTPDKMHYALVIIHDLKGQSISKVKIDIAQYNRKHHPDLKLKMTSANLDISKDIPLILIRKFKDAEEAMKFYRGVQKDPTAFIHTDLHYDLYVASQRNYRNIIRKKSTAAFRPFFEHFYIKGGE